jgi:hypothetical protein
MHWQGPSYAGDSESLQADVMRFMAIIAFCLIAILALVRNTEPVDPSPSAPKPLVIEPEPVFEPPEPPIVEIRVEAPDPLPVIAAEEAVSTPAPELQPEETVASVEAPPSPVSDPDPEEEGLTLRFASDGDFLRLIARGDIRVYAFQESDVLARSESYRFLDTAAPGQVYELLPPSIPDLILEALKQARPDTDGYRWGIALPGRISNQIEQHLSQVSRGELVIDRYGDVHHVAAS